MVVIFDGKKLAQEREKILLKKFKSLSVKKQKLKLISVLIGQNPASRLYVSLKERAANRIGIIFEKREFPADVDAKELIDSISSQNNDSEVGGIMMQLPLPAQLKGDKESIINNISPQKDVDCLTATNLELLTMGKATLWPATVRAIWEILQKAAIDKKTIVGKNICVLGRSSVVGQPLANLLINWGATVSVCHRQTKDIAYLAKRADIIVSATGMSNLIKGEMVKEGAVVIDVGSPQGDVDFKKVIKRASFITPVPGGVGPVTIISLLENFYDLIKKENWSR